MGLVYHQDQFKTDPLRLGYFVDELNSFFNPLYIRIEQIDLKQKNSGEIKDIFEHKNLIFFVYDTPLNTEILVANRIFNQQDEMNYKLRYSYHLMYDEYCRKNQVNNRFFGFCLDDFSSYLTPSGSGFKFMWLLHVVDKSRRKVAGMKKIPVTNEDVELARFRNDLTEMYQQFRQLIENSANN